MCDPLDNQKCLPCPSGKYQPSTNSEHCLNCDKGKFSDVEGAEWCSFCDDKILKSTTNTTGSTSPASCKCVGGEYRNALDICESVMDGVVSDGPLGMSLQTLDLLPGRWRVTTNSTIIYRCWTEDFCLGGDNTSTYCKPGHTGPYCEVCKDGYAKSYGACVECVGNETLTIILGSIGIIFSVFTMIAACVFIEDKSIDNQEKWGQRLKSYFILLKSFLMSGKVRTGKVKARIAQDYEVLQLTRLTFLAS
jgi:hypothetical protein